MTQVNLHMSMSLDGFVTGPNDIVGNGLGDGGERLHDWMFDQSTAVDRKIVEEWHTSTGAVIMGKHSFDVGLEPWGENPPFHVPVFVLSHEAHKEIEKEGGTTYYFVTDGIESALEKAQAAADNKQIMLHGANIFRQYLEAGLVDEVNIHLVSILLGAGKRLFEGLNTEQIGLEKMKVVETPAALHLTFHVLK